MHPHQLEICSSEPLASIIGGIVYPVAMLALLVGLIAYLGGFRHE